MQIKALKRARLAISLLACAALIGGSVSGFARADTGQANAAGALAAVQSVAPASLSSVAPVDSAGSDAAVVATAGATVSVPVSAAHGVQVKPQGPVAGVTVGLPFSGAASDATVSQKDGVVVYDNNNGSSTIPAVHESSLQITTVLNDAAAPTRYDYPFSLPEGQSLKLSSDGGATVVDQTGSIVGTIDAPWAKDANGSAVATSYEVHGNTLTQVEGIWVYWTWAGQVWCTGP